MSNKVTELNVTVCNKTKTLLEDTAQILGLTEGEVVDRLVVKCCPEEPEYASQLILDHIVICCAKLDQDGFNEAIYSVLKTIEESFENYVLEETKGTMKSILDKFDLDGETIDD